jgi:hypothetical protein
MEYSFQGNLQKATSTFQISTEHQNINRSMDNSSSSSNLQDQNQITQPKTTSVIQIQPRNEGPTTTSNTPTNATNTRLQFTQIIPQFLTNNPRPNNAWGASMDPCDPTSIRIFFQNINGLQYYTTSNRWQPHLETMKERGIDITGFAETNTNWNYHDIKSKITEHARAVFPNSITSVSHNLYQPTNPSTYQPGVCLQICTSHWTGRIIATITDQKSLGRWVGHSYRLKES